MTDIYEEMIDYIACDPEGLGMEPDETGNPALIAGLKKRWPDVTQGQISVAIKTAIQRVEAKAAAHFAEADALDALAAAREKHGLKVISGGGGAPEPRYRVMEMDEGGGGGFIILTRGFMEILPVDDEDDDGPKKLTRVDSPVGWAVDSREIADAFFDAMNERWERDLTNEPDISAQAWWDGLEK